MERVTPAIACSDLTAGYGRTPVLREVTLAVASGAMTGVLGPNGAGKTTLLRCLTGLCRPTGGDVRLFGEDASALAAEARARLVAVVPQELEMPLPFTVEETVRVGRTAHLGRWGRPTARDAEAVERAMTYTDVADFRHRRFSELSGGEKQRVLIALAVAQESRILMMDEATSHLDFDHRVEVMQLVERLNREHGTTVLLTSHDLNLAAEYCSRLLLLDQGRLVADGTPREVLTPETLRRAFRCDVRIQCDPATGSVTVVPARRLSAGRSGRGVRVHVLAGGGCGEVVLRQLVLCEYAVSAGVLNRGDRDAEAAQALGIPVAFEKPFSPIGDPALAEARRLAADAQAVVLCDVPFGPGNVANVGLAEAARKRGAAVFVMEGIQTRDYTPAREAVRRVEALLTAGAVSFRSVADLLDLLPGDASAIPSHRLRR
jgi:iron complex transport system ATP-binding protein